LHACSLALDLDSEFTMSYTSFTLPKVLAGALLCLNAIGNAVAQTPVANPKFDADAAQRLGADQRGMRSYVLVVLKTGPNKIAAGKERDDMFAGHFANLNRLASEGKLALAGPFDGVDGWRGLYVFAVKDIDEAKQLTATDPVIIKGEMIAEYHKWYGSAAVMDIVRIHETLTEKK
jgi:uncharacterized protein YciI